MERRQTNLGNRVDFYTEDYNDIINQKGMKCDWEQAIVCQCITEDSGQPDFTCPICHGSGFRYLPAIQIRVVSSSFSSSVQLETLTIREPGTAYVTPPSTIIMGYRDRLNFIDFECKFSETIRFKATSPYSNMTHRNIKRVIYLIQDDNVYEEGVDFEVTEDGYHLCWLDMETAPQEDTSMSLLYMTTPRYLVTDLLHELRATYIERKVPQETFKEFPKQYRVHREDFVYGVNEPQPPATPVEETPEESTGESEGDVYDY